jgi:hypothetical protein
MKVSTNKKKGNLKGDKNEDDAKYQVQKRRN